MSDLPPSKRIERTLGHITMRLKVLAKDYPGDERTQHAVVRELEGCRKILVRQPLEPK